MNIQFLTISEVAQELGLLQHDIKKLLQKGDLPAYQFGREVRIRVDDLDSYRAESRISREFLQLWAK
jgi:excisionase family DNA binding protein